MSSGVADTVSVCGVYRISSNTGVRSTTSPGVSARSTPTRYASGATIVGTRGAAARSLARFRSPFSALTPPESIAAFHATGDSSGLFDGAAASTRLDTRKLVRS